MLRQPPSHTKMKSPLQLCLKHPITQIHTDIPRGTEKHTNKTNSRFLYMVDFQEIVFLKLLFSFKFVYNNSKYILFIQLQTNLWNIFIEKVTIEIHCSFFPHKEVH